MSCNYSFQEYTDRINQNDKSFVVLGTASASLLLFSSAFAAAAAVAEAGNIPMALNSIVMTSAAGISGFQALRRYQNSMSLEFAMRQDITDGVISVPENEFVEVSAFTKAFSAVSSFTNKVKEMYKSDAVAKDNPDGEAEESMKLINDRLIL